MAAILGHELSHVVPPGSPGAACPAGRGGRAGGSAHRRPGRDLARTLAQTLVNVHYGREAEDRADAFSVQLLAGCSIAPSSFAEALERIRKSEPKDPKLLLCIDTHSPIQERIARAAEQAQKLSVRRAPSA